MRILKYRTTGLSGLTLTSTAIIAVFTVLLFFGAIWQVRTSHKIERAWIIVKISDVSEYPDESAYTVILPFVRNSGRTVARITEFCVQYEVVSGPDKLPPKPKYSRTHKTDFVLPPICPFNR